jgi:hypothetical protein
MSALSKRMSHMDSVWHRSVACGTGRSLHVLVSLSTSHSTTSLSLRSHSLAPFPPLYPSCMLPAPPSLARMNTFSTVGGMSYSNSTRTAAILATCEPVRYSFLPYGPKGHLVRDFMHGQWIVSLRPNTGCLHMLTSSSLEQTISLRLSSSAVWIFLVSGALVVFD